MKKQYVLGGGDVHFSFTGKWVGVLKKGGGIKMLKFNQIIDGEHGRLIFIPTRRKK